MSALLEKVAAKRGDEITTARRIYREILARDIAGQTKKDDADALGKCLATLELSDDDVRADRQALADAERARADIIPDYSEKLAIAIGDESAAVKSFQRMEERNRDEARAGMLAINEASAARNRVTFQNSMALERLEILAAQFPRVLGEE